MIIWLQGPSGAGKTTVGRELALLLGLPFIDLDGEIEREQGRSILDIFWSDGEAAFRRMEWNALLSIVEHDRQPKVIALGGGAVIDPAVRRMMKGTGLRVFLDISPAEAIGRLQADTPRPLLYEDDPEHAWRTLYKGRHRFYCDADLTVDAGRAPAEVASAIHEDLGRFMESAWSCQALLAGERSVVSGYRSLFVLLRDLDRLAGDRQLCIVADRTIADYVGDYLADGGGRHLLLTVDAAEGEKRLKVVDDLASGMAAAGCTRECIVVGCGGGVVTDLAGFLASIYMRGVRAIYIPTTLLAQVDAAIGGKTAVNAGGIRNLLGTFRQPSDVLVWPGFLRTLPVRELRSGFVESLKMGIANSAELADAVEAAAPAIRLGEIPENMEEVIRLSIRAKLDVVERDTLESSVRVSLNLGHTFGHALEAAEPGCYAHGEAVAFGLVAAADLALNLGMLSADRWEWIVQRALPFTRPSGRSHDLPMILRAMEGDKKRSASGLRFVLPAEETGVQIHTTTDHASVLGAMERAFTLVAEHHQGI